MRPVIVAAATSNLRLGVGPGNVRLQRQSNGLRRDSVINVTQLLAVDKALLFERIGRLTPTKLRELEDGLRPVLGL